MYALIQTADQGSVWRSDDAGATWKVVELGSLAHRPRRLLHPHGGEPAESGRRLHHEQQLAPLAGRRRRRSAATAASVRLHAGTGELRRLPRRLDRSEGSGPLRHCRRRRRVHQHASRRIVSVPHPQRADVSRARRQPRALLDLQQPPGRRHDARAVDELGADRQRRSAREQHDAAEPSVGGRGRGGGGGGGGRGRGARAGARRIRPAPGVGRGRDRAGHGVAAQHRRLRIGLHDSRSDRRRHRLRALLRQQGDALGRAHRHGAIDRAVDGVARLAAERGEVPLPLDLADGDRSVRSRRTCSTAAR